MSKTRELYYAQIGDETQCTFDHDTKRTYRNITRSSKKRISWLLQAKAISQYAHVFPYIDLFADFPPRGEL